MIDEIADIVHRARDTALEDALGVASLFLMLFAGLGLSTLI